MRLNTRISASGYAAMPNLSGRSRKPRPRYYDTLMRSILTLRAMFEAILDRENDIGQDLTPLAELHTAEDPANGKYEQQTPVLFAYVNGLSTFEYLAHWLAGLPAPYMRDLAGPVRCIENWERTGCQSRLAAEVDLAAARG